jgi:hypothetical protein
MIATKNSKRNLRIIYLGFVVYIAILWYAIIIIIISFDK